MQPEPSRPSMLVVLACVVLGVVGAFVTLGCVVLLYSDDLGLLPPSVALGNHAPPLLTAIAAVAVLVPTATALLFLRWRQRWAVFGAMLGAFAVGISVLGLVVA